MVCSQCGADKSETEFNWRRKSIGLRHRYCRTCQKERSRAHYIANRPDYLARSRRTRATRVKGIRHERSSELRPLIKGNHAGKWKLLQSGVQYQCATCGIHDWLGKVLVLHLDHIDGNRGNNTLDNLRLLCPNCHSQTETYCGKNRRRYASAEPIG